MPSDPPRCLPASLCPPAQRQIEQCLARDEATFPKCSALLDAPRCILRVLAWNLRSAPSVPLAYGAKRAFSCVRAVAEIPMPKSWTALRACRSSSSGGMPASASDRGMHSSSDDSIGGRTVAGMTGVSVYDVPGSSTLPQQPPHYPLPEDHAPATHPPAGAIGSPRAVQVSADSRDGASSTTAPSVPSRLPHAASVNMSGWASRLLAGSHPRVAKTQARTLKLEIEVAAMEERLKMARGILPSAG